MSDQQPIRHPEGRGPDPGRDRRVEFFLFAAVAALLLYWPAPEDLRFVPMWLAIVYIVLAVLTALDRWSRSRSGR